LQNQFIPFKFAKTFPQTIWLSFRSDLSRFLIIYIQFEDVSNQRKSEAQVHFFYNKAQTTPTCNLCSGIQKEVVQALKV